MMETESLRELQRKKQPKKLVINKARLRPLEPNTRYFESLIRSIIFQQLSGKAAAAILKKFNALFVATNKQNGTRLRKRAEKPTPASVLTLSDAQFRSAGLSLQKATYLRDLSQKFLDKTIDPKKISSMSDGEIIAHLTQVKGIGEWTAHMFLIFTLARPNVLPTGDLAIKKGFQKAFNLRALPDHKKMHVLAKPYAGEHTTLALYLWQILDDPAEGNW